MDVYEDEEKSNEHRHPARNHLRVDQETEQLVFRSLELQVAAAGSSTKQSSFKDIPIPERERMAEQTHFKFHISGVTDLTQEIPTKRPDGR